MAVASTKLEYKFNTAEGSKKTQSYNYVKSDVSDAAARTLGQVMVSNGKLFAKELTDLLSVQLVVTNVRDIPITSD